MATGFSFGDVKKEYEWLVKIEIPTGVDKSGQPQFTTKKMICIFHLLPRDEINAILAGENASEEDELDTVLHKVFKGWKEGQVTDENGEVLESTQENIEQFLNVPFVRRSIFSAYTNSLGGSKALRKN